MTTEKTINFLHNRIEVDLPDQMAHATQVLTRMTLNYYGQMSLFEEPKGEVLQLFNNEGEAA